MSLGKERCILLPAQGNSSGSFQGKSNLLFPAPRATSTGTRSPIISKSGEAHHHRKARQLRQSGCDAPRSGRGLWPFGRHSLVWTLLAGVLTCTSPLAVFSADFAECGRLRTWGWCHTSGCHLSCQALGGRLSHHAKLSFPGWAFLFSWVSSCLCSAEMFAQLLQFANGGTLTSTGRFLQDGERCQPL